MRFIKPAMSVPIGQPQLYITKKKEAGQGDYGHSLHERVVHGYHPTSKILLYYEEPLTFSPQFKHVFFPEGPPCVLSH